MCKYLNVPLRLLDFKFSIEFSFWLTLSFSNTQKLLDIKTFNKRIHKIKMAFILFLILNEKDIFIPRKCFKTDFTFCFFIFVLVTAWRKEIHAHRGDLLQSTFLNLIW